MIKKHTFQVIALFCMLLFSPPVHALEWSCGDMKKLVDSMYNLATVLNKTPYFDENPQVEKSMDKLLASLGKIVKDEEIPAFTSAFSTMNKIWQKETWNNNQRKAFLQAFDSTTTNLERVYEKYCDE